MYHRHVVATIVYLSVDTKQKMQEKKIPALRQDILPMKFLENGNLMQTYHAKSIEMLTITCPM